MTFATETLQEPFRFPRLSIPRGQARSMLMGAVAAGAVAAGLAAVMSAVTASWVMVASLTATPDAHRAAPPMRGLALPRPYSELVAGMASPLLPPAVDATLPSPQRVIASLATRPATADVPLPPPAMVALPPAADNTVLAYASATPDAEAAANVPFPPLLPQRSAPEQAEAAPAAGLPIPLPPARLIAQTPPASAAAAAAAPVTLAAPPAAAPPRERGPKVAALPPAAPAPENSGGFLSSLFKPFASRPDESRPAVPGLPAAGGGVAIYDIAAHTVYLPNGERLEAHSGLGSYLDDPNSVHMKNRGATPPATYDLTLRESLFHGVAAIRLNPVRGSEQFGRDGLLAHTYMLGPRGDSNGCISFRDYGRFLNAFRSGQIKRIVVVKHMPGSSWRYAAARGTSGDERYASINR